MCELLIETHDDLSFEDHVDFVEGFPLVDNRLSRYIQAAIEPGNEERNEFIAGVVAVEREEVVEVAAEALEEFADQAEAEAGFQLVEKLIVLRDLVLVIE